MDIVKAYAEAAQGMIEAWNKAQAYFDANLDENGALKEWATEAYQSLLGRVEQFDKQIGRLDRAMQFEERLRAAVR